MSATFDQPQRILVVDDDEDIRDLVVEQLEREHYELRSASALGEIKPLIADWPVDLIVLDLNLPDGDGLTFCRELRAEGHSVAVIMVTARDSPIDRVLGLELGADDYLTKPFEPRELLARIRNLLRRRSEDGGEGRNKRYARIGAWRLDLVQRRLIAPDERLIMLSSAEFRLLERFVRAPNVVLSRERLLPERKATVANDRSIDLQISRLRQKLADAGADLILTVRNEGYVLASSVTFE